MVVIYIGLLKKYETENKNKDLILYPTGANLVGYFDVLYIININYLLIPYAYSTFAKSLKDVNRLH